MAPQKRVNKSKPEILDEMAKRAKIERQKELIRRIFPLLEVDTMYDMQTALLAVSGYIKEDIERKVQIFNVNDMLLDFKGEPDTKITKVMNAIKTELQMENAVEVMDTLETFGNFIPNIGVEAYLKKDAKDLTLKDLKLD